MVTFRRLTFLSMMAAMLYGVAIGAPAVRSTLSQRPVSSSSKPSSVQQSTQVPVAQQTTASQVQPSTAVLPTQPVVTAAFEEVLLINGKLAVPVVGKEYTVGFLLKLINANNPQKTSTFLVPTGGNKKVIDDSQCDQAYQACYCSESKKCPHLSGSTGASAIGITTQWKTVGGQKVAQVFLDGKPITDQKIMLSQDERLINLFYEGKQMQKFDSKGKLISELTINRRLDDSTKEKYKKILLYFTLFREKDQKTYRCYLNDPFPGVIVKSLLSQRSPVESIISKWNIQ